MCVVRGVASFGLLILYQSTAYQCLYLTRLGGRRRIFLVRVGGEHSAGGVAHLVHLQLDVDSVYLERLGRRRAVTHREHAKHHEDREEQDGADDSAGDGTGGEPPRAPGVGLLRGL